MSGCYANTDREIWRKGDGDGNGMSHYEPSIHVTEGGRIGIAVGGTVYVREVEDWHAMPSEIERLIQRVHKLEQQRNEYALELADHITNNA